MKISVVAALDRNFLIGSESGLPWKLPADLRRFKLLTTGKPLVMGRKTFETIGRPLPGRETIVLTRSAEAEFEGCAKACSVTEALQIGERLCHEMGTEELMIAGGAEVYKLFLPLCERFYLTLIDGNFSGRHFFPTRFCSRYGWGVSGLETMPPGPGNSVQLSFCQIEAFPNPDTQSAEERLVNIPQLLRAAGIEVACSE